MALLAMALLGFGCGDNSDPAAPPDAPLSPVADAAPIAADANPADAVPIDATPAPTAPYLLVGSSRADNVLRFDQATGAFIDEFIPAGAGGIDDPDHIVARGDSIYISGGNTPEQSGIYRYQLSTGAFVEVFAAGGGLHRPYGFAFGPDERLYVSSFLTDQILRYDATTGAFIDVFATGTGAAGGLNGPNGMVFDADGRLYVSTQGSVAVDGEPTFPGLPSQVLRFDIADGSSEVFIDQPELLEGSAGFISLLGLAFGPDCDDDRCDLFVSDFANGIRRYDSDAALVDSIVTSYTGATTSNFSGSLVFGADGQLFSVGFDSTDGSANQGVVLRWDGDSGAPMPGMNLTGALLVEDSDPVLIRPIGIEAVSP